MAREAVGMLGPRVAVRVELITYLHSVLCGGREVRGEVWSRVGWEVVECVIHHWVLWGRNFVGFLFQAEVAQEVVFVNIRSRLLGWCVPPGVSSLVGGEEDPSRVPGHILECMKMSSWYLSMSSCMSAK